LEYPASHKYFTSFTGKRKLDGFDVPVKNIDLRSKSGEEDLANSFLEAIKRVMLHRRFFLTRKGNFGIGPMSSQAGDLLYLFAGGRTPYIIRQGSARHSVNSEGCSDAYTFVGECYCHGIMDGEALESDMFSWKDVRLC
jgi:hypothetical protein